MKAKPFTTTDLGRRTTELAVRAKAAKDSGDLDGYRTTMHALVEAVHKVVIYKARRAPREPRGPDLDDYYQVGMATIAVLVDKFEPGRDLQFLTKFGVCATGYMLQESNQRGRTVRVPSPLQNRGWRSTISPAHGLPDANALPAREYRGPHFEPEEFARLAQWLSRLPDRDREVLARRYGLDDRDRESFVDIGKAMHITKDRVRHIADHAVAALKKMARAELPDEEFMEKSA